MISLREGDVRHTVEKVSMTTTTLLQTSLRSKVSTSSKLQDSHLGVPGQKAIWMWPPWRGVKNPEKGGGGATTPSIIRKIKKVHGGEQVPRDGGFVLSKDVAMEPLGLKGLFNPNLSVLISNMPRVSDGSPGGHANLSSSLPGLEEDSLERILAIEMPSASLGPEIVEEQAPEDVEWLPPVGESTRVVAVEVRGVVFFLKDDLPKEDEGPSEGEAVWCLPYAEEGFPSQLGKRAVQEAMLGGFRGAVVTALARGLDPHLLEPSAHRQTVVER